MCGLGRHRARGTPCAGGMQPFRRAGPRQGAPARLGLRARPHAPWAANCAWLASLRPPCRKRATHACDAACPCPARLGVERLRRLARRGCRLRRGVGRVSQPGFWPRGWRGGFESRPTVCAVWAGLRSPALLHVGRRAATRLLDGPPAGRSPPHGPAPGLRHAGCSPFARPIDSPGQRV